MDERTDGPYEPTASDLMDLVEEALLEDGARLDPFDGTITPEQGLAMAQREARAADTRLRVMEMRVQSGELVSWHGGQIARGYSHSPEFVAELQARDTSHIGAAHARPDDPGQPGGG